MKKGELTTLETILVIFIFIVLLIIGLIVFYRFNSLSIQREREEYETYKFELLVAVLPNMAELKCSNLNIEEECIDVSKIGGFASLSKDYFKGKAISISIEDVYLKKESWKIYENKPRNYNRFINVSTPVTLYYPNEKKYSIGVLKLGRYV